jgi:mycobactin lysine-N-oxygenase
MSNDQVQQSSPVKTLVVVGGGPKAAAIAAKAHVLAKLGFPKAESDDWKNVLARIKSVLDEANFETWFSRIQFEGLEKDRNVIRLLAPNYVVRDWVKANHEDLIVEALGRFELSNFSVEWMLPKDKSKVQVIVIERGQVGANWRGEDGYTDGKCELGTPPEKDVGFPYASRYGTDVDKEMLEYTWHAFKILGIKKTMYGEWIDRGHHQPLHEEWGRYLRWVLTSVLPREALLEGWEVTRVEPADGRLQIHIEAGKKKRQIAADGIVFTGPGSAKTLSNMPNSVENLVFDGRNYWTNTSKFKEMIKGKIGLIGGGETAASIALSLIDLSATPKGPVFDIDIINRHGTIFTRGESYRENRIFTNPDDWKKLDEPSRHEIIQRTDRGVFSVAAQLKLNRAERVKVLAGRVEGIERAGNKIDLLMKRGDHPKIWKVRYDKVIIALGFDAFQPLELFPQDVRPVYATQAERQELQRGVDSFLRVSFDSAPAKFEKEPNVHMPMLSGFAQGPGFPNLSCLGHLSDRILARYITPPDR